MFGTLVYDDPRKVKYGLDVLDDNLSENVWYQFQVPFDKRIKTDKSSWCIAIHWQGFNIKTEDDFGEIVTDIKYLHCFKITSLSIHISDIIMHKTVILNPKSVQMR